MRTNAQNPKGQVAEVAQVVPLLAPLSLRLLLAPGVLMLEVQVRVTKSFAIFTVHGVRLKTEDPNIAHQATHANLFMLLINKILIKGKRQRLPATSLASPVAVPVARARSTLFVHHPQP